MKRTEKSPRRAYFRDTSFPKVAMCLNGGGMGRIDGESETFITDEWSVRRLTTIECARLQGFPDTYCHISGKPRRIPEDEAQYYLSHGLECWQKAGRWYTRVAKDGPIYKAYGNSMAVPVIGWILDRIEQVENIVSPTSDEV